MVSGRSHRLLAIVPLLMGPATASAVPVSFDPLEGTSAGECSTPPVVADVLADVGGTEVPIHGLAASVVDGRVAESSACLLLALSIDRRGGLDFEAEEAFGPDALMDVDVEGLPEIVEGWEAAVDSFGLASDLEIAFHVDQPGLGVTSYRWVWSIVDQPFEIATADVRVLSPTRLRVSVGLRNTGGDHDPALPLVSTRLTGEFTRVPEPALGVLLWATRASLWLRRRTRPSGGR